MTADIYTVASGGTLYAGCAAPPTGYPAWRPAPGFFADVSLNTLLDVAPAGWPNSDTAGPYSNWSSAVSNPDLSPLGGISNHGSGHLASPSDPFWAGVNNFNASTRLFSMSNVPPVPLSDGSGYNGYGEISSGPAIGHTAVPHTYGGLLCRRAAAGGGPKGSLVRLAHPGSGSGRQGTHEFDVSLPSTPGVRKLGDTLGGTSYPMAAVDEAGTGFYYLSNNGNGPMRHYVFADYSYTVISGSEFNEYGDYCMTLIPGPRACLVATGRSGSGGVDMGVYVAPLTAGVPGAWVQITPTGTRPADARCGTQWSVLLQCLVSYEGNGSYLVHRLTPPATGSLTAGTWAWTSETVAASGGVIPSKTPSGVNGAWGRFIESVECGCFFWCDSVSQKMQAWTLQGM